MKEQAAYGVHLGSCHLRRIVSAVARARNQVARFASARFPQRDNTAEASLRKLHSGITSAGKVVREQSPLRSRHLVTLAGTLIFAHYSDTRFL